MLPKHIIPLLLFSAASLCAVMLLVSSSKQEIIFTPVPRTEKSVLAGNTDIATVELSILNNIKQNGFNNQTGTQSGLWINWKYGTNPLQTNFNGSGKPDATTIPLPSFRHDPLTDMRYLHALWLYKSQNPTDSSFDSEIAKYTPLVKSEFTGTVNERGWIVDEEFLDIYRLSQDIDFKNIAIFMGNAYETQIDKSVGIMYKKNTSHPGGYYRPSDVISAGCAMIAIGRLTNNQTLLTDGKKAVDFVFTHAYLPQFHTFTDQMDTVKNTDGTVNASEIFYVDVFRNYTIYGNAMRIGEIAQISLSLLHAYIATGDAYFLTKAQDLLDAVSLPGNQLGMWNDTPATLGFNNTITFSGHGPYDAAVQSLDTTKKEAGRQITMLWTYTLANNLLQNRYAGMEQKMLTVALTHAFYAPGHGVIYQVNSDWTPLVLNSGPQKGLLEDFVTTEAMGAALEGLLATGDQIIPLTLTPPSPPISLTPTQPVLPTPSVNPSHTIALLSLCPHGLGNCGDNVSQTGRTQPPLHQNRTATVTVFDLQGHVLGSPVTTPVQYTSSQLNFQGTVDLGNLPTGNYLLTLQMNGFLPRRIASAVFLTHGQTTPLPPVFLTAGNIDNNQTLDLADYNILVDCYGDKQTQTSCTGHHIVQPEGADLLDDDGQVDGGDYNLLLREFSVQTGQ